MQRYGSTELNRKVALSNSLPEVVMCVDKFPPVYQVPEDTIVYLTGSQPGCQVGGVYTLTDGEWRRLDKDTSMKRISMWRTYRIISSDYHKRFQCRWESPSSVDDHLSREVLVRKTGEWPSDPEDGEVLISSITPNEYKSSWATSKSLTDLVSGRYGFYRLFHIFSSGAIRYTDVAHIQSF